MFNENIARNIVVRNIVGKLESNLDVNLTNVAAVSILKEILLRVFTSRTLQSRVSLFTRGDQIYFTVHDNDWITHRFIIDGDVDGNIRFDHHQIAIDESHLENYKVSIIGNKSGKGIYARNDNISLEDFSKFFKYIV